MFSVALMDQSVCLYQAKNYPTKLPDDQFKVAKLTGFGTLVPFSLLNPNGW